MIGLKPPARNVLGTDPESSTHNLLHPDAIILLHPDAAWFYRGLAMTIASDPQ